MAAASDVFDLPDRLAAKRDPALIADDERHFARIAATLADTLARLTARREAALLEPGGEGQEAMDRDLEIHRLGRELGMLRRYGVDLTLGRMVDADGTTLYIGRLGLSDAAGDQLLVDWRAPVAEPFFGATHARPMGLASRRRYRWTAGRITDYWDEVFTEEGLAQTAALDDQSAFLASLGAGRTTRMRDVLGTIQADQDAIIRAGSSGARVIDGGPGTGKTVVALHRAAYLLYSDPSVGRRRGGVLVVGPSHAYLDYVADVLPSLGEEGVRTCTLRDLVPEGASAGVETSDEARRLKESGVMVRALERALRRYEQPPTATMVFGSEWGPVRVTPDDWADAFGVADPAAPHNESREEVWRELVDLVASRLGDDVDVDELEPLLRQGDLRRAFHKAWPLLDPLGVAADLLGVPGYLRACAPELSVDEVAALTRDDARAWTDADLPLLDAARQRIGDPETARIARRRAVELAHQRATMDRVVDDLIAGDDSELLLSTMLRGADAQNSLIDDSGFSTLDRDPLAGPFAHVVVDEAQELTDAEWGMLLRRTPSRSFTIVGDRAQARHGFDGTWAERLARVGLDRVEQSQLTVNYRTPEEVMAEAAPVILAAIPDANVPTSIRASGIPVRHGAVDELDAIVAEWLAAHADGVACVIGEPGFAPRERVASLDPATAKGLEFDLVVLVDPSQFGAVDRYVAMTRATQQLVVLG